MKEYDFLGRGLGFPVASDLAAGRLRETAEEEDIRQAVYIILSTKKGERIMRPEFGCDIYNFMFGTMDYTSLHLMEQAVMEALIRWEPRIRDIQVRAAHGEEGPGRVLVQIGYVVRTTNNQYNIVYPFFISEGIGGGYYDA